jgi:hypothetical protein
LFALCLHKLPPKPPATQSYQEINQPQAINPDTVIKEKFPALPYIAGNAEAENCTPAMRVTSYTKLSCSFNN